MTDPYFAYVDRRDYERPPAWVRVLLSRRSTRRARRNALRLGQRDLNLMHEILETEPHDE